VRNPSEVCDSSSRSVTKARYGSIVTLFAASRIHRMPAAIQRVRLNGMAKSESEQRIAPTRK
jgi:hypothetical protein